MILKTKIQQLSADNLALREINVRFQIENYNLQKKIRQLESIQNANHETIYFDADFEEESEDEERQEDTIEEVPNEEYLEEYEEIKIERSKPFEGEAPPSKKIKMTDDEDELEKPIIYQIENYDDLEVSEQDANEAMTTILEMAARKGSLDKIKSVGSGRQRDSAFVSKILDAVFDKITLASSSAQGQRYQSNPSRAPRPALDSSKLSLCRRAFYFRLQQEEVSEAAIASRLKLFLNLVNNKVQNARKCLNRSDSTRLQET